MVLVFFGDHLPYLGDNQLAYTELGMEVSISEKERVDVLCSYETPYVIWANDAAAETLDWETVVSSLDLADNHTLSASFLGAVVLELTGRLGENAWFRFLNELRRDLPVVHKKTYMLPDGTYIPDQDLDDWMPDDGLSGTDIRNIVAKWRQWSYFNLRYKDIPS